MCLRVCPDISDESVVASLRRLDPKLQEQLELTKKVSLIDALKVTCIILHEHWRKLPEPVCLIPIVRSCSRRMGPNWSCARSIEPFLVCVGRRYMLRENSPWASRRLPESSRRMVCCPNLWRCRTSRDSADSLQGAPLSPAAALRHGDGSIH